VRSFLAQGRSIPESLEIAQDVARKLVESYVEHGDPLPEQLLLDSGQAESFDLRIPILMVQSVPHVPACAGALGTGSRAS
jgi:antitoxin HicB